MINNVFILDIINTYVFQEGNQLKLTTEFKKLLEALTNSENDNTQLDLIIPRQKEHLVKYILKIKQIPDKNFKTVLYESDLDIIKLIEQYQDLNTQRIIVLTDKNIKQFNNVTYINAENLKHFKKVDAKDKTEYDKYLKKIESQKKSFQLIHEQILSIIELIREKNEKKQEEIKEKKGSKEEQHVDKSEFYETIYKEERKRILFNIVKLIKNKFPLITNVLSNDAMNDLSAVTYIECVKKNANNPNVNIFSEIVNFLESFVSLTKEEKIEKMTKGIELREKQNYILNSKNLGNNELSCSFLSADEIEKIDINLIIEDTFNIYNYESNELIQINKCDIVRKKINPKYQPLYCIKVVISEAASRESGASFPKIDKLRKFFTKQKNQSHHL